MADSTALIVAEVTIIQDRHGRYNLNLLHQASEHATDHAKAPNRWVRLKSTKALLAELQTQVPDLALDMVHGGDHAGTYAHELLAVSYAGWISPAFQLKVNQAFLDRRRPQQALTPIQLLAAQGQMLVELEQRQLTQGETLAALQTQVTALEAQYPPTGKLTPRDWLYRHSKPRLPPEVWKAFTSRCRTLERPEMFRPNGAAFPWSYYSPATLEAAYTAVTRQLSFLADRQSS